MYFICAKNHKILLMHAFVTSKNVKWCHLIWPTLYRGSKSPFSHWLCWSSLQQCCAACENNNDTTFFNCDWYVTNINTRTPMRMMWCVAVNTTVQLMMSSAFEPCSCDISLVAWIYCTQAVMAHSRRHLLVRICFRKVHYGLTVRPLALLQWLGLLRTQVITEARCSLTTLSIRPIQRCLI